MMGVEGVKCVVTGGSGFTGRRLVEMLVERGAAKVVSFDITPKPVDAMESPVIQYIQGDLTKSEDVDKACEGADCVWHIAALVGPFHKLEAYMAVNYMGTLNVLGACKRFGVAKLIMSSSPSTRFDGKDIDGLREDQLKTPKKFLQMYAESKAMGEKAVLEASCDSLLTVAIAPHQIYGPRQVGKGLDTLFLPSLLEAAGKGQLRIFGNGNNKVSFTYIDNYCHGLILGYDALFKDSPALGKFYIVTDGGYQYFWRMIDAAGMAMGFASLFSKMKLPTLLMMIVAYICNIIGWVLSRKLRVNPFTVKMLVIHRWFDISAAELDLKYKPIVTFDEGFATTIDWFKENWLPKQNFKTSAATSGVS
ncbi:unnamed protein product [Discosporangium mesarthrocarpum]